MKIENNDKNIALIDSLNKMMHLDPSAFQDPENINISVWRYISFAKYVSMLQRGSLHLSSVYCLRNDDPFEGSSTYMTHHYLKNFFSDSDITKLSEYFIEEAKKVFVNCWHMNSSESNAMWKLYGCGEIAIHSTYSTLKKLVVDANKNLNIGMIKYIDDYKVIPTQNFLYQCMCKKNAFRHEAEIRIIKDLRASKQELDSVIEIQIDISSLIDRVYVAPKSPSWFLSVVKSVSEKYGLKAPIETSTLDQVPIF